MFMCSTYGTNLLTMGTVPSRLVGALMMRTLVYYLIFAMHYLAKSRFLYDKANLYFQNLHYFVLGSEDSNGLKLALIFKIFSWRISEIYNSDPDLEENEGVSLKMEMWLVLQP